MMSANYFLSASARASNFAKELDFQYFVYRNEERYPKWYSKSRILSWIQSLPDDIYWNAHLGVFTMISIVLLSMDYLKADSFEWPNLLYHLFYGLYVFALFCKDIIQIKVERYRFRWTHWISYLVDVSTYSVFFIPLVINGASSVFVFSIFFYYVRFHRTFRFLMALNEYNFRGTFMGTLIKYLYLFALVRIVATNVFIWLGEIKDMVYVDPPYWLDKVLGRMFFKGFNVIHKLFILIGPDFTPQDDKSRLLYIIVMIVGCLLLMGLTIASLALIIAIHMRPEEMFRLRFRLILNDMRDTCIPSALRKRVETFYKMYWHKQKAVSVTQLLPTFPPTIPCVIYTNIYFKALQKSLLLRDLSYQILSEMAKYMETIHFIPGDPIIKRNSAKDSIIYISYGDVEMLSAEDDDTSILRFTRGTIINPCGASTMIACTRSQVAIRAATFCTAHVLKVADLWKVATKHGKSNGQAFIIHSSFEDHIEKVKNHYVNQVHSTYKYKSNIIMLKRNLIDLKEARDEDGNLLLDRPEFFIEISGCYYMRNRTDLEFIEDSDEICLRNTFPCILQPQSSLQITWNILIAVLTLIVTLALPYHLVYRKSVSPAFRFFNFMVTLIYIFDVIVHLSTGAKIEEGVPITFRQTSSLQMMSYWFILDIIAAAPIFEFIGDGHFSGMNKLFKIPKMFRVLKQMEDFLVYQSLALRFMAYFLLIFLLCYLVAALQQSYWCLELGYCVVKNITEPPYWVQEPLDDINVRGRLAFSMYWSLSMITLTTHKTAHVNDELWHNQIFVMVILEVCTVLHIVVESSYSATVMVTETMHDQYITCIETVKNFLLKNNIDPILRLRFINYLQLCWYTNKAYSITQLKSSVLFDLPPHVYQSILAMQRSKYILCVPFMKFLNNAMLKNVSSSARLFYTSPNEILLNTGDITNELYVIKKGFCEIFDPVTKKVVQLISARDHFGAVECLLRIPAYYTVRAVTHVQIFSISRKNLKEAIETPKIKDAINFAKQQPEYVGLQEGRAQFLWYEPPLDPPNRQIFPLPRKYEPDYAFLEPFRRLGFCSILRYVFPRFTIRPDSTYLKRYEWFRAACAFAAAIVYPMYSFLELQWPGIWHLGIFLDFSAYFDICQRMLVGYFDDNGILVYHPASTAAQYIRRAFVVDVLACIPLEMFDRKMHYMQNDAYKHPDSYQYFMYNRILQLYRLPQALEILNEYIDRQDITLIIKAFPLFISLLVIVASLVMGYSVEKWSFISGDGWNLKAKSDPVYGNWIEANADQVSYNITGTPWNLMLTTFYWVAYETTHTGFNIFQPSGLNIMIALFLSMLVGTMMNTYFAVRIISIRSNVNQALAAFQDGIFDILKFMKKEKLDKDLQHEVISYYEYTWDKTGGTNYRSVLKLCDQITLRTDAILHIYGPTFTECPILHGCELALLRIIGRAVYSLYFRENMTIIERDDIITEMYFVEYGTIEVRDSNYDSQVIRTLPRGSAFGNLEDMKTTVCPNKFIASSDVHLLKINAEAFHENIKEFPNVKTLLKKYRPHQENYIIGGLYDDHIEAVSKLSDDSSTTVVRQWILKFFAAHSKVLQRYLIVVSILCVYGDLYNAGFQKNDFGILLYLYILDACFVPKIFVIIFQPTVREDKNMSKFFVGRKKYITTEFKYDVLSCIPFELLSFIYSYYFKKPRSIFAFLRLNRLFRVVTVYNCLRRIERNLFINLTLNTIASVVIWFTLIVHTTTCMWNLLGWYEDYVEPRSSWRYMPNQTLLCENYLCAMYFVLTTFTQNGVGDILPRKQSEVAFVSVLMIMSKMIYMIYVGEFSNIIQFRYFRFFSFYAKYIELKEFLKNNRVSENLAESAHAYSLYLWQESRGLQIPEFLSKAPQCLRLNIMAAAYMEHLKKHAVFKNCDPAFLRHLAGCLHPFFYDKNMYVVKEGDITNSMYFIHKGRVNEIDDEYEDISKEFTEMESFGSMNGLDRDVAYQYSYKTAIKSQVLTLTFDDWEYLLKHFPECNDKITNYRRFSSHDYTNSQHKKGLSFALSPAQSKTSARKISVPALLRDKPLTQEMVPSSESSVPHAIKKTQSGILIKQSEPPDSRKAEKTSDIIKEQLSEETPLPIDRVQKRVSSIEKPALETKEQDKLPFIIKDVTHTDEQSEPPKSREEIDKKIVQENDQGTPGTFKMVDKATVQSNDNATTIDDFQWPLHSRYSEARQTNDDKENTLTQRVHQFGSKLKTFLSFKDIQNENTEEISVQTDNNEIDNNKDELSSNKANDFIPILPSSSPSMTAPSGVLKDISALIDTKDVGIHDKGVEDSISTGLLITPTKSDSVQSYEEFLTAQKRAAGQLYEDKNSSNSKQLDSNSSDTGGSYSRVANLNKGLDSSQAKAMPYISSPREQLEVQQHFSADLLQVEQLAIEESNFQPSKSDALDTYVSSSTDKPLAALDKESKPMALEDNNNLDEEDSNDTDKKDKKYLFKGDKNDQK